MSGLIRSIRLLLLAACLGLLAVLLLSTPASRNQLARFERTVDGVEHRTLYRMGKPLRGTPNLAGYRKRLRDRGLKEGAPVFVRVFKQESELELWLHNGSGFVLFATYPVCHWSGSLGPKLKEGDGQSPEGFYSVSRAQLNPNSRWHRSFNLGFPNAFDKSIGRTGSYLMVHGGCASIGCYAMTNPVIDEIWRLVAAALRAGQSSFAVHSFPFRMSEENMAWYGKKQWNAYWRDLKAGYDLFERTRVPPRIRVCQGRYRSAAGAKGSVGSEPLNRSCSATASAR